MKKMTLLPALLLLALGLTTSVYATPDDDTEKVAIERLNQSEKDHISQGQWDTFSRNLVKALKSEHDGLKAAAMGMVIRYGNQVHVKDAVFEVMKVYRNHENHAMRRMALVTLGQMESEWAIGFLERAQHFEENPVLLHTLTAVVAEYRGTH